MRPVVCLLLAVLGTSVAGCFPDPDHKPDAAPDAEPGATVIACSTSCEEHISAVCASATDRGLCTCAARGNSRNGSWDCLPNWIDTAPPCAVGTDPGSACSRAITRAAEACAVPGTGQVCYCSASLTWRCPNLGQAFGQAP